VLEGRFGGQGFVGAGLDGRGVVNGKRGRCDMKWQRVKVMSFQC
jgi:hypothetical protein